MSSVPMLTHAAVERYFHIIRTGGWQNPDLHKAVLEGALSNIRGIVQNGVDVNSRNGCGETALAVACSTGNGDAIHELINCGAAIDEVSDPNMIFLAPIFAALEPDDKQALYILLCAGVNVNVHTTEKQWTPLHLAAQGNQPDKCFLLLEAGARVDALNAERKTPLMSALESYGGTAVSVLVDHGANVNAEDLHGRSVFEIAMSSYANEDILFDLLVRGADAYACPKPAVCSERVSTVLEMVGIEAAERFWAHQDASRRLEIPMKHAAMIAAHVQMFAIQDDERGGPFSLEFVQRLSQREFEKHRAFFDDNLRRRRLDFAVCRFAFIRQRAATICMSLFMLRFPALVTVFIIERSFLYTDCIRWHWLWNLAVMVRHFHDKKISFLS